MATSRICSITGCNKTVFARGWCRPHYGRWRDFGDPMAGRTVNGTAKAFFEETVMSYEGDGCLIWPYVRNAKGYGLLNIRGQNKLVSRLVCERIHGPAPSARHQAAHDCGNGYGGCVAKKHLYWATPKENSKDRERHGSLVRGSAASWSKLSERDVVEIRAFPESVSQREIAAKFGVCRVTVSDIRRRKTWGWI